MIFIKEDFTDFKMIRANLAGFLDKDNISMLFFGRYIFKTAKCLHCHQTGLKKYMKQATDREQCGWDWFCPNCVPKYAKNFPGIFD